MGLPIVNRYLMSGVGPVDFADAGSGFEHLVRTYHHIY